MIRNEVNYSPGTNCANVKLTSLTFNKDSSGYYLSAKYRVEDQYSIRELDIPKIRLRVRPDKIELREHGDFYRTVEANIGFGWLPLNHNGTVDEVYFTETVLEEKTHEMTLDEIEKKLGYKVKIVNRKE